MCRITKSFEELLGVDTLFQTSPIYRRENKARRGPVVFPRLLYKWAGAVRYPTVELSEPTVRDLGLGFPGSLGAQAYSYLERNLGNKCPSHFPLVETEGWERSSSTVPEQVCQSHTSLCQSAPFFLELSSLESKARIPCRKAEQEEGGQSPGGERERRRKKLSKCLGGAGHSGTCL